MRRLILLNITASVLAGLGPDIGPAEFKETCIADLTATPLCFNGTSYIRYNVCSWRKKIHAQIKLINDLYPDGIVLRENIYTTNVTEEIVYDNRYTRSVNYLEIHYSYGTTSVVSRHEIELSKGDRKSVNNLSNLESDYYFLHFNYKNGWTLQKDQYQFINFNEYYIPNYYHKLNLNDFQIKVTNSYVSHLFCGRTYLMISNPHGISEGKNLVVYDCKIIEDGTGKYHLSFSSPMYVNPSSLEMSDFVKGGFVKTKYYYFPRNEMRHQDNYTCQLIFEDFGIDKDLIILNFKFKALINTVGDCHNSEYCILAS